MVNINDVLGSWEKECGIKIGPRRNESTAEHDAPGSRHLPSVQNKGGITSQFWLKDGPLPTDQSTVSTKKARMSRRTEDLAC
jgi:hypothetical protein